MSRNTWVDWVNVATLFVFSAGWGVVALLGKAKGLWMAVVFAVGFLALGATYLHENLKRMKQQ